MSENSTRPHSEKGVGPARRPSTRRIGASGLRNKPKWRSMRLKLAAIWRMLPEIFRIVFMMRVIEGMSVDETADLLGLQPETVKTRLHRARRLVRKELVV